jgi:hypothetical protein
MLREFHDSRIANGQQDRADRIAFVSDMVKKRAEFVEKLNATRNRLLKDITSKSAAKIADNATNVAALIKESTGHANRTGLGKLSASQQPESAINAGIVTTEMNVGLLSTRSAAALSNASKATESVSPKAAAPVTPKAAAPVTPKAAAPVTPKAAAPAPAIPKAAAPVAPTAAESVSAESSEPVAPNVAAPATPKAASTKRVKSRRNR